MEGWNNQILIKKKQGNTPTVPKSQEKQEGPLPNNLDDQILLRSKDGISIFSIKENKSILISKDNQQSHFTKDGKFIICVGTKEITLYDVTQNNIVNKTQFIQIMITGLSATNNFLLVIEKQNRDLYILHVLSLITLQTVLKESFPYIRFSQNDEFAFRVNQSQQLEIYEMNNYQLIEKGEIKHSVDYFNVSPDKKNQFIICILAEIQLHYIIAYNIQHQKGFEKSQAKISIFNYVENKIKIILEKPMEKASEITAIWSPDGKYALIQSQTWHDDTGNSYYGQHGLLHFSTFDKTLKRVYCPDGPIHDIQWSPSSQNFIVISGFMPATSILYKNDSTPFYEFGKHHRNTIRFSPFSRFIMIAGFGNLSGEIDFWDLSQMKIVGKQKASSSMSYEWAPDGRQLLTGTLFPRLRVENNFKVFYYSGQQIISKYFNESELYEVQWKPSQNVHKDRPASRENSCVKSNDQTEKPRKILNLQNSSKIFLQVLHNKLSKVINKRIKVDTQMQMRLLEMIKQYKNQVEENEEGPTKKKRIRHKKPKNEESEIVQKQ